MWQTRTTFRSTRARPAALRLPGGHQTCRWIERCAEQARNEASARWRYAREKLKKPMGLPNRPHRPRHIRWHCANHALEI
jgi:hypothetical protein